MLVDNTLWKGLVLHHTEEGKVAAPNPADFGAAARMMKVAESMHELNEYGIGHPALQVLQLPMRDGLTIMRYNPST